MSKKILIPLLPALLILAACETAPGGSDPGSTGTSVDTGNFPESIVNGSFENGLEGWTVGGSGAFVEDDVSDLNTFKDGVLADKEGTYVYAGGNYSLASFTGTMQSDPFILGGIGQIALKMGAMKNADLCYIEFYEVGNDTPLSFTANGGEESLTKLTNADFDGVGITSHLIRNVIDLSAYLDKPIYIKVTDNDIGSSYEDYSFCNLDDFKVLNSLTEFNDAMVEREDALYANKQEPIDQDPPVTKLRNGNFETGDTSYWLSTSGTVFKQAGLLMDSKGTYWEEAREYFGEGSYFLSSFVSEELTGTIRSEKFTVTDEDGDGHSYVSFMIGGGRDASNYVAVVDGSTGIELMRQANIAFKDPTLAQGLVTYYLDVSDYIGDVLYFSVVDGASGGGFAGIEVDDFRINLSLAELEDSIAEKKAWASGNPSAHDDTNKALQALYNGGMSFPLAGSAPAVKESGGYALDLKMSPGTYSLLTYLSRIEATDDYTSSDDLKREIVSGSCDGSTVDVSNLASVDMSTAGEYVYEVKISDAYGQSTTTRIRITTIEDLSYSNTIENGDFETGDASGWELVAGTANLATAISSETVFWAEEIPFNKQGTWFWNGWTAAAEADTYTIRSTVFTLGGSGYISFKIGGRTAYVNLRNESGDLLATYYNSAFNRDTPPFPYIADGSFTGTMVPYVADVREYMGQNLYIELVDNGTADWGVGFFDDIKTYYASAVDIGSMRDTVSQNGVNVDIPYRWASEM